ncbi:hypothetical protein Pyn_10587 [Prunus yedoensis var. nudiflora]|uniref:Uncharacterized protein n=1 Tax=Prunus yedoensis var. nudiflora TaxID=2094558 RepID=A0A314V062_PRUYE|nr:hypothetical protein Pyn_10587 [Prunus yedoensis var. nudiflora]
MADDNMRTTTYHTFLPTTAEEEEAKRANSPENQARRIQVEIRKRSREPFMDIGSTIMFS